MCEHKCVHVCVRSCANEKELHLERIMLEMTNPAIAITQNAKYCTKQHIIETNQIYDF